MPDQERAAVSLVLTTAPDQEVAERIGATLVEERLAACANVLPGATSIFRWKGAVQREAETLVLFKTADEGVAALSRRIVELHPYDVPEVIVLPVTAGHPPYLAWVRQAVRFDAASAPSP